ncbi:MAG: glycosyltransferase family 39 protein [Leptolyngbya sp. BL-A-14]
MRPIFRILIVVLIVLGIFFRVANLEQKIITCDECITEVRASAYQDESVWQSIQRDQVVTPEAITKFQQIKTHSNAIDTIKVTAIGAPQHPPLYWLLIRFWMQIFGNSVSSLRYLSVIFSVLTFPALYWLCWELFRSAIVGWLAIAFIAVSPVHIFQAQNARPYSLWILLIVMSSAALLRALKSDHKWPWLLYGLTLALSLYTYLFSIFVLLAHGAYVLLRAEFQQPKKLHAYLLTSGLALLSFSPWLLVVLLNLKTANEMTSWTGMPVDSQIDFIWSWVKNLADMFLFWNIHFELAPPLTEASFVFSCGTALVILVTYAFYFLQKQASKEAWVFIFALTSIPVFILIAADLILGGRRSALGRYVYPSIIGIQIAVSYLLGMNLTRSVIWRVMAAVLLSCGVLSCAVSAQAEMWDGRPDFYLQSARIINQTVHPLVISDDNIVCGVMPLNAQLTPNASWLLVSHPAQLEIPYEFSDVFLYNVSNELKSQLEKQYKFRPAYQYSYPGSFIWKAQPPSILWQLDKAKAP